MSSLIVSNLINNKFIRFLFVGVLNTVFGYSIYAILIYLHVHYSLAALGSTMLGVLFSFKTTGSFVFKNKNNKRIFKFIGVYAVIYIINITALKIFNFFKADMYMAGAVMIMPMAAMAFILNKNLVFKE